MSSVQDQLKREVALAALDYVLPLLDSQSVLGIGTGSTADCFIDALAVHKHRFAAAVASSERSAARLQKHGIQVLDLNRVDGLPVYVDGADEIDTQLHMLKGGGGALTREKIVAAAAEHFVCIVDESKLVKRLGCFPLPVEVIPMALQLVARQLSQLGGNPVERSGFVTDNGGLILDVAGLHITDPVTLECTINNIAGVISCGLFARAPANVAFVAGAGGVRQLAASGT